MGRKAYLTIDDSPSERTEDLCDFLAARSIPAVLFCRGARMEEHPEAVIHAIQKGFIIGNHTYSHKRASELTFEEAVEEIEKTERLIEASYEQAGVRRPAKYFRFPHMDRGCGGWIVDYDALNETDRKDVMALFGDGLNIDMTPPGEEQKTKKKRLQDYLRDRGFEQLPCSGVTHTWFAGTELAQTMDAMFTFSTSDWMVTERHKGKWPYKSLDDLRQKIHDDPWLGEGSSANIILTHDEGEIFEVTTALIETMLESGFEFQGFEPKRQRGKTHEFIRHDHR